MTESVVHAFVAYDFALAGDTDFPLVMEAVKDVPPPGVVVAWPGAPGDAKSQGTVWKSRVQPGIDRADRVLAFVDLPNANVGFEIGYALGRGKRVAVYRYKSQEHPWQREPPLAGLFRHQLRSVDDISTALVSAESFITLQQAPRAGKDVIVLYPRKSGAFAHYLPNDARWRALPSERFELDTLHLQLEGAGAVIWIIAPHVEGGAERDGAENAALSTLAGYAEARPEFRLLVFRHPSARIVADIEERAVPFTSNKDLRERLAKFAAEWQAKHAPVPAPPCGDPGTAAASAALAPMRPHALAPLPTDTWEPYEARFIGRERQLIDASEAIEGLRLRFRERREASGSAGVKLIWVHGFGGMGKSWFLNRVRRAARAADPASCALVIDFDPRPQNAWKYPLRDAPSHPEALFDVIATRMAQQLGVEAVDDYWLAKARVAQAGLQCRKHDETFGYQLVLAKGEEQAKVEPDLRQRLRHAIADDLWELDAAARGNRIARWSEDPSAVERTFEAWCRQHAIFDEAEIAPHRVRVQGLQAALCRAMQTRPLVLLLDTLEVLDPSLQRWLCELLLPLLLEPEPLLVLIGSRLPPDAGARAGSRAGFRAGLPGESLRVEAFAEQLRFSEPELERALTQLGVPPQDVVKLAEQLHRVSLGVPLTVSTFFDLHREGNPVLSQLAEFETLDESDGESVKRVIAIAAERLLLHLADDPNREHDYRAITALALLTGADEAVLAQLWGEKPRKRLLALGARYSLLAELDLHPTVRETLRRHWRAPEQRPEFFDEVLAELESAVSALPRYPGGPREPARFERMLHELDLRAWRGGVQVLPALARALCLATAYELDCTGFVGLLRELPLPGPQHASTRALRQGREPLDLTGAEAARWLAAQLPDAELSDEERACLALLEGIACGPLPSDIQVATLAFAQLQRTLAFFGEPELPRRAQVGEAFFWCGFKLHGFAPGEEAGDPKTAAAAYERAIALGAREVAASNNLGHIYADLGRREEAERCYLRAIELDPTVAYAHNGLGNVYHGLHRPEEAERYYLRAIELDPTLAYPHNGLGNLYRDYLDRPEEAERCYLRVIELHPKVADPHNGLAILYRKEFLDRPEEAERCYLRAIELDPKVADPHIGLGYLKETTARWAEARVAYERGAALDPKDSAGKRGLAWVLLRSGTGLHDAQRLAAEASALQPTHFGNALLTIATSTWVHGWPAARSAFNDFPLAWQGRDARGWLLRHRDRLAALLREVRRQGYLDDVVAALDAAAGHDAWRPWFEATKAVVEGLPAEGLRGAARTLHQLLDSGPSG